MPLPARCRQDHGHFADYGYVAAGGEDVFKVRAGGEIGVDFIMIIAQSRNP